MARPQTSCVNPTHSPTPFKNVRNASKFHLVSFHLLSPISRASFFTPFLHAPHCSFPNRLQSCFQINPHLSQCHVCTPGRTSLEVLKEVQLPTSLCKEKTPPRIRCPWREAVTLQAPRRLLKLPRASGGLSFLLSLGSPRASWYTDTVNQKKAESQKPGSQRLPITTAWGNYHAPRGTAK